MPSHVDEADTSANRKRETRQTRVEKAMRETYTHQHEFSIRDLATAAIEAYPDPPRQKKERGAPKTDKDSCALYAQRGEFQELYDALMSAMVERWGDDGGWPRAAALLRSLKEQGVVS